MSGASFNLTGWLRRIGLDGPVPPDLSGLRAVVAAQSGTIPFENVDVLLGHPPKLDIGSLQAKMVDRRRGGYCFEQNALLGAGLTELGFKVTRLLARVIRGRAQYASAPATHMMLRVDLAEGSFLADTGYGNQTPTAPLPLRPGEEFQTPHEMMRLVAVGGELTLQARAPEEWQSLYRLSLEPRTDEDFEVANWFTATHPASPFVSNLIVARPGPGGVRNTVFNGRVSVRRPGLSVERRISPDAADLRSVLAAAFGLDLDAGEVARALDMLDRRGTLHSTHPFFV